MGLITDSIDFVQGVAVVIRQSAKRKDLYESMFGCDEIVTLLATCPTRWFIRTIAIKRVCRAYREIAKTLEQLKDDKSVRGETRSKVGGRSSKQRKLKPTMASSVVKQHSSRASRALEFAAHQSQRLSVPNCWEGAWRSSG